MHPINCHVSCNNVANGNYGACNDIVMEANNDTNLLLKIDCYDNVHGCNGLIIHANYGQLWMFDIKGYFRGMQLFANNVKYVSVCCTNPLAKCRFIDIMAENATDVFIGCGTGDITSGCQDSVYHVDNVVDRVSYIEYGSRHCDNCIVYAEGAADLELILNGPTYQQQNFTIIPPQRLPTLTSVECIDYGCSRLNWMLLYGLNQLNVSYAGECHSDSDSLWIDEWDIYCLGDDKNIVFDGKGCNDQSVCCNKTDVDRIHGKYLDVCPVDNDGKVSGLNDWEIGIIIGVVIGVIIVCVMFYINKRNKQLNDEITETTSLMSNE